MKATAYPYDDSYRLAFPAMPVILHNSNRGLRTESVNALLDTGSDATIVPLPFLRQIKSPAMEEATIRSHWGERRPVELFLVDVTVGHLTLPGIFVVGDDVGDNVILGRDVLNKLRLELDGRAGLTKLPPQ